MQLITYQLAGWCWLQIYLMEVRCLQKYLLEICCKALLEVFTNYSVEDTLRSFTRAFICQKCLLRRFYQQLRPLTSPAHVVMPGPWDTCNPLAQNGMFWFSDTCYSAHARLSNVNTLEMHIRHYTTSFTETNISLSTLNLIYTLTCDLTPTTYR